MCARQDQFVRTTELKVDIETEALRPAITSPCCAPIRGADQGSPLRSDRVHCTRLALSHRRGTTARETLTAPTAGARPGSYAMAGPEACAPLRDVRPVDLEIRDSPVNGARRHYWRGALP